MTTELPTRSTHSREWRVFGPATLTIEDTDQGIKVSANMNMGAGPKVWTYSAQELFDLVDENGVIERLYRCLNCDYDYGLELPYPENDPMCGCSEHSTAEGEGLIVREGDTSIKVWVWAHIPKDLMLLGYKWFFKSSDAEDHISKLPRSWLHAHTLEEVEITLKQEHYEIQTKEDLVPAIDRWYLDNREDLLLKMITKPQ